MLYFDYCFLDSIKARIIDVTLEKMLASKNQINKSYIISKQHHEHYVSGMRMFLNNPLSGVGVKILEFFAVKKNIIFLNILVVHILIVRIYNYYLKQGLLAF